MLSGLSPAGHDRGETAPAASAGVADTHRVSGGGISESPRDDEADPNDDSARAEPRSMLIGEVEVLEVGEDADADADADGEASPRVDVVEEVDCAVDGAARAAAAAAAAATAASDGGGFSQSVRRQALVALWSSNGTGRDAMVGDVRSFKQCSKDAKGVCGGAVCVTRRRRRRPALLKALATVKRSWKTKLPANCDAEKIVAVYCCHVLLCEALTFALSKPNVGAPSREGHSQPLDDNGEQR